LARYTIRYINRTGAPVGRVVHIACPDDAAAIRWAFPYAGALALEIWQGERLVRAFPRYGVTGGAPGEGPS